MSLATEATYAAQVIDLHKHYYLGEITVHALRGVNLNFPHGDFVAIMGSSGSGKSTLLNLLGALDRPTGGKYILGGYDVSMMSDDDLSAIRNQMIGFIFQSYNLIAQYTVLENIEVPLHYRSGRRDITSEDHDRCEYLADLVGLGGRLDHRPYQLSGGQQQRVAIARALAHRPRLVFADEPTGNLHDSLSRQIMELMARAVEESGCSLLLVTHNREMAGFAKRRLLLEEGQLHALP
jgi:putative ABC transport system ATP-binding protein